MKMTFGFKPKQDIEVGQVLHLKIISLQDGIVQAEDVTPEPGAEIGYCCSVCGIVNPAEPDGSLPKGWARRRVEDGRVLFVCDADCMLNVPFCRVCGCTEQNACMTATGACHWVEKDLCSACAPARKLRSVKREVRLKDLDVDSRSMALPEGKSCGLCQSFGACNALIGIASDNEVCDFYPNRFWETTQS